MLRISADEASALRCRELTCPRAAPYSSRRASVPPTRTTPRADLWTGQTKFRCVRRCSRRAARVDAFSHHYPAKHTVSADQGQILDGGAAYIPTGVDEEAALVPELNEGAAPESEDVLAKEAL